MIVTWVPEDYFLGKLMFQIFNFNKVSASYLCVVFTKCKKDEQENTIPLPKTMLKYAVHLSAFS